MKLKEKRIAAGFSQQGLADATGVPRRTIQNWERDVSKASVLPLKKVADALGCKVDDLI